MDDQFAFTPTLKENERALRAIARSMAVQVRHPLVQILCCVVIYGLPLSFAAMFFWNSFEEIYLTFFVFVVVLLISSRFGPNAFSGMARRLAVPQELRLDSENISHETERAKTTWPWASLNRLHVLNELIVLEFHDWSWLPIPDRLWTGPDGKQGFLEKLHALRPDVAPSIVTSSVRSPFSLINVGAGFAAAEFFLLLIFGVTSALLSPDRWPAAIRFASQSVPTSSLAFYFGGALLLALLSFLVIRSALRSLQRRRPRLAAVCSAIPIAIFAALVLASFLHHPCDC